MIWGYPYFWKLPCLKYEQKMLQRWGPLFMFSDTVFFAQPMVTLGKLCWVIYGYKLSLNAGSVNWRIWTCINELGNSSTIGRFARTQICPLSSLETHLFFVVVHLHFFGTTLNVEGSKNGARGGQVAYRSRLRKVPEFRGVGAATDLEFRISSAGAKRPWLVHLPPLNLNPRTY